MARAQSAERVSAAGADQAVTAGSSMALDSPCATWKCAPIGRLIPWTRATDAFEKAMPACSEPTIIASRAARSPGASQTRRRFAPIDRIAAIAIDSENGLACFET